MSDADTAIGIVSADGGLSPAPGDAEAVFEAMQSRLDELTKLPIIHNDAVARGLLDDMARGGPPDDLVTLLNQLDDRVRVLLARKGRTAPAAPARRERPPRTLLRL